VYHAHEDEDDKNEEHCMVGAATAGSKKVHFAAGSNTGVKTLKELLDEKQKKQQLAQEKSVSSDHAGQIQQLQALVAELQQTVLDPTAHGLQQMMTADTKPTAKAGTKSDPMTDSGRDMSQVICYGCNQTGHMRRDCPNRNRQNRGYNNNPGRGGGHNNGMRGGGRGRNNYRGNNNQSGYRNNDNKSNGSQNNSDYQQQDKNETTVGETGKLQAKDSAMWNAIALLAQNTQGLNNVFTKLAGANDE
jgi:hypothetical protein